jgi:hypothetical protein
MFDDPVFLVACRMELAKFLPYQSQNTMQSQMGAAGRGDARVCPGADASPVTGGPVTGLTIVVSWDIEDPPERGSIASVKQVIPAEC